jgi:DHA1 family multidrug resistance protein-like MFS transporter
MTDNRWKVTLGVLSVTCVLMSLSYTMLVPFLPMYLSDELGVDPSRVNLWSGIVFSAAFLVSGIMAPVWGAMADRHSRKMMALRAAVLLSVSYTLGGLVQNEWQLLAMRCFQGFSAGLWPACLAIMSSAAPRDRLGFSLGTLQGAQTAGGVLGPLFGGVLSEFFGMRATFFLGGASLLLAALLILVFIKEPPRRRTAKAEKNDDTMHLFKIPAVRQMLVAACLVQFAGLVLQPVLPQYIGELLGSNDRLVLYTGILFSLVGVAGVVASPVWGALGQSWSYRPMLCAALGGTAFFGMVQCIPDSVVWFGIWRFVGGITFAGIFPAINAVLTMSTAPEDRGRVFGLSYAVQQAGSVIGMFMPLWFVVFVSGFLLAPIALYLLFTKPDESARQGSGEQRRFD